MSRWHSSWSDSSGSNTRNSDYYFTAEYSYSPHTMPYRKKLTEAERRIQRGENPKSKVGSIEWVIVQ